LTPPTTPQIRWDLLTWLTVAVVTAGTILRFAGIGWGLPLQLHADEWVVVEGAIDMAARNSFEPPFFFRPDHLETQASYLLFQAWSHLFGGGSPEVLFAENQAPFYALARAVSALFGSAMIPVAALIGARFDRRIALFMAFAVAFFPPFVEHSRYATPDIALTFACMIVILGCVRYIVTERWWDLTLAVFGVALGITAKYPAVLAVTVVAAAVVIASVRSRHPWRILTRGVAAALALPVMVFALSPSLFTNFAEVRRQLFQQNSTGHLGADGLDWGGNMWFYATSFVTHSGVMVLAFSVAGAVWLIVRRRWEGVPLALGAVMWVAISSLTLHWDRWGLPMYLTPLLLAAIGVAAAWDGALLWAKGRRALRWAVGILSGIAAASLIMGTLTQVAYAFMPDTRSAARDDLAAMGINADDVYYDGYTPFLTDGPRSLADELQLVEGRVVPIGDLETRPYVMTSSLMVNRYLANPETQPEYDLYSAIPEQLDELARWSASGAPPSSWFEPLTIVRSIPFLIAAMQGATSGPVLVMYGSPAAG